MAKTLVIVESPAKAKTIKKYLGSGYDVVASKGHLKDLPKNQNAVDVANDFTEKYEVIVGKEKVLQELKDAAKKVDAVLLATDPDREGEAIAWHILEEIQDDKLRVERVEFHEITKKGVDHGVQHPRPLDINLYDAQRARRVLDRIVGYDVSALVWSKLAFGLSAGRVQSVALRLIVDREREIDAFVPEEYWNVSAGLSAPSGAPFVAKLAAAEGEKFEVKNGETAAFVRADLESANCKVAKVTRREQKRNPPAPYTTSKLQQDATNSLHFGTKRTMQVAQGLYEGVDLKQDGGPVGLITYIRTDSTRVSDDAVTEVRQAIEKRYGKSFVPDKPNVYKSKKNAQDAHEAIRPTDVNIHPESVKKHLKDEQYKLYKLIWNRFVASQMTPAVYDRTTVEIHAEPTRGDASRKSYMLRSTGRVLKDKGWLEVTEGQRDFAGEEEAAADGEAPEPTAAAKAAPVEEDSDALLPEMNEGDVIRLSTTPGVVTEQKFTQPSARYNEGSLVRELEKRGIGRPSTYAEIISKVQQRAYVEKLPGGAFQPTQLGKFVVEGLVRSNLDFMDPNFTAQMEEELDEVGAGKIKREQLLKRFYKRFRQQLEPAKKLASWKPPSEKTGIPCEECGEGEMIKKWGKNGYFLSCSRYPKCKATRDLSNSAQAVRETDITCDKCGKPMVIRTGRFGDFLSCTGYPGCKNARPVPLGVACPQCGGDLIEVRPRKKGGRTFYGCSNFNAEQKCDFKLWAKPIATPCPTCGAKFLTRTAGKKPMLVCATKDCGFKQEVPEEDEAGVAGAAPEGAAGDEGEGGAADADATAAPKPSPTAPKAKAEPKPAPKAEAKPKAAAKTAEKKGATKTPTKSKSNGRASA
ncbi:type I DNA topoisomerase [Polyangium sorediatum]|uniref:DNA topoisomerase 1 n=1 Tax=Polyangium sorediatum TaxID=889274 RepID=A0ABT6P1D1_9BACT|nr:type I DNA topoisomerase [Polyangium sorediatum]MDI1434373.1 type I DNA topoisomerase [Polyangium sorediatum]